MESDIAYRIWFWRSKAGLSRSKIAREIGVDHSAVSKWEYGVSVPTLRHLLRFASICGVDMVTFWKRLPKRPAESTSI